MRALVVPHRPESRARRRAPWWQVGVALLVTLLTAVLAREARALECGPLASGAPPDIGAIVHRRGLLWRILAPNGAESTLLGTMHVADPRVSAVRDAARVRFDAAGTFVMEVVLDAAAIAALQRAMFYADDTSLRETLGERLFARAAAVMADYGLGPEIVARMKPWAVFLTLSQPPGQSGAALDLALMLDAQASGKSIIGLESVADQIGLFEALEEGEQVAFLREMACHHEVFQAEIEDMVERYAARDLAGLSELSLRHVAAHNQAFVDALLWQRNERMLQRLGPVIDAGDAFIAVGALHLPGTRGLLQSLERDGYTVEMIY